MEFVFESMQTRLETLGSQEGCARVGFRRALERLSIALGAILAPCWQPSGDALERHVIRTPSRLSIRLYT